MKVHGIWILLQGFSMDKILSTEIRRKWKNFHYNKNKNENLKLIQQKYFFLTFEILQRL